MSYVPRRAIWQVKQGFTLHLCQYVSFDLIITESSICLRQGCRNDFLHGGAKISSETKSVNHAIKKV